MAVLFLSAIPGVKAAEPTDAVTVLSADGTTFSGELRSLSDETLVLGGPEPQMFDVADLVSVTFDGRTERPIVRGSGVWLANGDRIAVRPRSMDEERLSADWPLLPEGPPVEVPLETVRAVVPAVPEFSSARTRLLRGLLDRREESDLVVLRTGDRITGDLIGLDADMLTLDGAAGETQIERGNVRAVGFNAALISFPPVEGPRVLISLADGSRLTAREVRLTAEEDSTFEAAFGPSLQVPRASVVSLRFLGRRAAWLSDLEPAAQQVTPFLSIKRELRRDRNVLGGPLMLRGVEYPKGLGMHSRSEVDYDLQGRYRRFLATVGIDDAAGGGGQAVFAVEVDGERVFTSDPLTGNDPPLSIGPIDLTGKDRLTLLVEFGDRGDILDYANWCNPVLIGP